MECLTLLGIVCTSKLAVRVGMRRVETVRDQVTKQPMNRRLMMQRSALAALGLTGAASLLSACGGDGGSKPSAGPSSAPAPAQVTGTAIYLNYPDWIGKNNIADFQKKYPGAEIKQTASGFESLSGVAQTVAQNPGAYDMLLGSCDIAEQLKAGNFVLPIDDKNVPGLSLVTPRIRELFPYGMPLDTGFTGIGYRKDVVKEKITGWADFWNLAPKYSRRVVMLGVDRAALGAALLYKGFDSQSTDPTQLEQARDAILAIKPHVLAFKVTGLGQSLLNNEADLVMAYNYEIAAAMQSDPNIGFVTPDDGTVGFVEGVIGVSQTDVPDVTRAFMDFMIQPTSYADFVNTTNSARTSTAADNLINKPLLAPILDLPANAQMLKFLGAEGTSAVNHAWSGVQAS